MLRGIETASSGLIADEAWQQVLANNLAQLNTPGYKSETAVIGSFQQLLIQRTGPAGATLGAQSAGTSVVATVADFSQGPLQQTGNPLDVAIQGNGFFAVQTPQGLRYTRAGAFSLDAQGNLVTPQGYLVLGSRGQPLKAGVGASIGPDGSLSDRTGVRGQLGIWSPAPGQLTDMGGGFFAAQGTVPPMSGAKLTPGFIEGSNVSAPEVLGAMIQVLRHFEAGQQFLNQDATTLDRFIQVAS